MQRNTDRILTCMLEAWRVHLICGRWCWRRVMGNLTTPQPWRDAYAARSQRWCSSRLPLV